MKIEFKNVNQGDSIVISWKNNDELKYGYVDCNKASGNPILNHIRQNVRNEIDFLFISHPHHDHFSGALEVLKFCQENKIIIKKFGITFNGAIVHIYHQFSYGRQKDLKSLLDFIRTDSRKNSKNRTLRGSIHIRQSTGSLSFSEFNLHFLAPIDSVVQTVDIALGRLTGEEIVSKPDLNKYSTVFELETSDGSILLTSDATKHTIRSIHAYYKEKNTKFKLVQIPHHGSVHNHYLPFWHSINKVRNCPAVFSVGEEVKDCIPDLKVVQEISNEGFEIFSTNIVYGISEFLNGVRSAIKAPSILKSTTKLTSSQKAVIEANYSGDKEFVF
jgi:beta-lactamase superfamily II metal-dependent hydrolase